MSIKSTYSNARQTLADLWREVEDNHEVVIINRRGHADVALISADELSSLLETAHLLRSPKNAQRLFKALRRALSSRGKTRPIEDLRRELGLERPSR